MQWITVAAPSFSMEQVKAVFAAQGGAPDGLLARYTGTSDGQVRIIGLWESKAHADRFFAETLPPSLVKALGPEPVGAPETVGFEVTDAYLREPVA